MKIVLRKCRCGTYKAAGDRWRVLRRDGPGEKSLLKCLQCGHRWHSRLKYVGQLRDHTEKSRRGMTDEDILLRLTEKTLAVDARGLAVTSTRNGCVKRLTVIEREHRGTMYRFVSVCHDGKKKKVSIHRLVWMSFHRRLVPDGHDVDHIHGRNCNFPDGIENLRLLPATVNRSCYRDDFVTEEVF